MIIGIILLLLFLIAGMPIAFGLGAAGVIGLIADQGWQTTQGILMTTPFRSVASYTLVTIPLFIFMAELLDATGLAKLAYVAAYKWIGHLRGGLGIATVLGGAVFGAVSGSSTASCATFGAIAIPEMRKYKYSDDLSAGIVALSGTLAAIIPPSILLVIYGAQTDTSIGKVLIAGVIPGIMMTLLYSFAIWLIVKISPEKAPPISPFPWIEKIETIKRIWPLIIIGVAVLGAIYTGITTPTEAAALGAVSTFLVGVLTRTLTIEKTRTSIINTLKSTAMIFALVIGATIFTYFLTFTGASQAIITTIAQLAVPRLVILLLIIVLYIFLGMFLPAIGTMLLTIPLVGPLLFSLGYDQIWFGILMVMLLEIGLVTPPVGLNCFVTSGTSGIPLEKVFKGALPLLLFSLIGIALLIAFPQLALWLPSMMK